MAEAIPLAEAIVKSRQLLDQLWDRCTLPKERKKIRRQKDALDLEMMRLISIHIQQQGEEYEEATRSLTAANQQIEKALAELERLADALEAVATAIDFIAQVKPA